MPLSREEAKARILKLYFDDNCFGEDFAIFIDEVYANFDKELDKAKREAFMAGWNESGEGWNAEYGVDAEDIQEKMEEYLKDKR